MVFRQYSIAVTYVLSIVACTLVSNSYSKRSLSTIAKIFIKSVCIHFFSEMLALISLLHYTRVQYFVGCIWPHLINSSSFICDLILFCYCLSNPEGSKEYINWFGMECLTQNNINNNTQYNLFQGDEKPVNCTPMSPPPGQKVSTSNLNACFIFSVIYYRQFSSIFS